MSLSYSLSLSLSFLSLSSLSLPSSPPRPSQAATGEIISTEDLGGADVHCRISGCTDHYVETEEEGLETTRRIISSLNLRQRRREGELAVGVSLTVKTLTVQ